MERHNYQAKYEQRAKIVAWAYVVAAAAIIVLPFLSSHRANFLGYELPHTFVFAAIALVGLGVFAWRFFKNESINEEKDMQPFNFAFPAAIAAIALVIFLTAGDTFVDAYVSSGKQKALSVALSGHPTKLAFWWGPFVYCAAHAVAAYFLYEMNEIIKEFKRGNY